MIRPETHIVKPEDRRNSPIAECFYCKTPVGEQHKPGCVIRLKTVVVRMTIEYVIDVPEHWSPSMIDFHRNESSWCASNGFQELERLRKRVPSGCTCLLTGYKFLRDATKEDEESNAWGEPEQEDEDD